MTTVPLTEGKSDHFVEVIGRIGDILMSHAGNTQGIARADASTPQADVVPQPADR